jgi:hypothetical protein
LYPLISSTYALVEPVNLTRPLSIPDCGSPADIVKSTTGGLTGGSTGGFVGGLVGGIVGVLL